MRWARLSERAHLSAAGLSIETRALLVAGRRDQSFVLGRVARLPVTQLVEQERTLKVALEGVPGMVGAPRCGHPSSVCHKPAVSSVQTEKHRTTPRNVDYAEKTSAGAYLATGDGRPAL